MNECPFDCVYYTAYFGVGASVERWITRPPDQDSMQNARFHAGAEKPFHLAMKRSVVYRNSGDASCSGSCPMLEPFLSGLVMRTYQIKRTKVARIIIPTIANAFIVSGFLQLYTYSLLATVTPPSAFSISNCSRILSYTSSVT